MRVLGMLVAGLLGPLPATTQHPEEPAVRPPLPSPATIASLPPDGGEDFNRLVHEQSPYLLQHARNPVDWYPWGPEAFERAAREDKPVFLSVGYSTCHWCHVMEHESFEDEEVAALLNEHFVCVKVDREERPDIDQVYMTVTQQMTGRGGWPMTVVMTPDKKPFFAGTYFPKRGRFGGAGMMELLPRLAEVWQGRREEVLASAEQISDALARMSGGAPGGELDAATLDLARDQLAERFDATHGGFGPAPKFPVPHNLRFLLRRARRGDEQALAMAEETLRAMRLGGIWDHVGFGFHRYSTDPMWLLPHFEKMLYDQALLAMAYVEAWQLTGEETYERTAREILTYVQRDMTSPDGAFYSAEDADSEGEEGLFYVWKPEELREVLGEEDGDFAIQLFGVETGGNFEDQATGKKTGDSILHLRRDLATEAAVRQIDPEALAQRVESIRERLFDVREHRVHPLKDDKVLTDWNGLMIAAFAMAAQAFGDEEYAGAARRAADFLLTRLRTDDGRLHKRYRAGEAGLPGMLEDHVFAAWGLLELYETVFDERYLRAAKELADTALEHFWDDEAGGFFMSPDDGEPLIVRAKEIYDGAIPSGNSVAALVLLRLARMTGQTRYEDHAERTMRAFSARVAQMPQGHTQLLLALDLAVGPAREIVVAGRRDGEETRAMLRALQRPFLPNDVVLLRPEGDSDAIAKLAPFVAEQRARDGKATAYVCENFACQAPTTDLATLEAAVGVRGDGAGD